MGTIFGTHEKLTHLRVHLPDDRMLMLPTERQHSRHIYQQTHVFNESETRIYILTYTLRETQTRRLLLPAYKRLGFPSHALG